MQPPMHNAIIRAGVPVNAAMTSAPQEMQKYHQFICWKQVGKDKFPTDANGEMIDAHDRRAWLSYDDALATGRPIGFVFTHDDPFVFIDLDHCIDAAGDSTQFAQTVAGWFPDAASELSVSGDGLHLFVSGSAGIAGHHKTRSKQWPGLEIYSHGRFAALTGYNARGDAGIDYSERLQAFVAAYGMSATSQADQAAIAATTVRPEYTGPVDDNELVRLMISSAGSAAQAFGDTAHVRDLWCRSTPQLARHFPDAADGREFDYSAADMAFFNHLAFWTGCDAVRMVRLFRQSALYRPDRYEGAGAYRITRLLSRSIASCSAVYSAAGASWDHKQPAPGAMTRAVDVPNANLPWSALKGVHFAPTQYLVPDLIPEGVTLFSAKPKVGKSMFVIGLACATLAGGVFMGRRVAQGAVLHLGLEDTPARLQKRYMHLMHKAGMSPDADWPVTFWTAGGIEPEKLLPLLQEHMAANPAIKLIIVDTLEQVRPPAGKTENAYKTDRRALDPITNWLHGFPGVSLVVIHHNRKDTTAEDPFDDVSGSTGIGAAVDAIIVAREDRSGEQTEVTMSGRGRELEEFQITTQMIDGVWQNFGNSADVQVDRTEQKIIDELRKSPQSLSWRDIADPCEISKTSFFRAIKILISKNMVEKDGTRYRISPFSEISKPGAEGL